MSSCAPTDLVAAAGCISCLTASVQSAAKVAILCQWAAAPFIVDCFATRIGASHIGNVVAIISPLATQIRLLESSVLIGQTPVNYVVVTTQAKTPGEPQTITHHGIHAARFFGYKVQQFVNGVWSDSSDPCFFTVP
jgi:hypothetical protein